MTKGTDERITLNVNGDGSQGTYDLALTAFDVDPGVDLIVDNPFLAYNDRQNLTNQRALTLEPTLGTVTLGGRNRFEERLLLAHDDFSNIFTEGLQALSEFV